MGSQWFLKGFPMDPQWVPNGFPMDFRWAPNGFPMDFQWIPNGFPMFPNGFLNEFPMDFQWILNGSPMDPNSTHRPGQRWAPISPPWMSPQAAVGWGRRRGEPELPSAPLWGRDLGGGILGGGGLEQRSRNDHQQAEQQLVLSMNAWSPPP